MATNARPLALVTGASSGIGADLARELARDGHDLVLVARRVEPLQALGEELKAFGASTAIIAADLSKAGTPSWLADELSKRQLVVDVLVNNAGIGDNGGFHRSDPGRIAEMLQVNIVALTALTRLLLPGMIERRRGRVLLVSSTAAFQPGPYMAVYYATKAYVSSLGEAIAYELRGTGVTVTVLCPGPTATGFAKEAKMEASPLFSNPLMRPMSSAEVARQGYRALRAGRRVVVPGAFNRLAAFSARLAPRSALVAMAATLNGRS